MCGFFSLQFCKLFFTSSCYVTDVHLLNVVVDVDEGVDVSVDVTVDVIADLNI